MGYLKALVGRIQQSCTTAGVRAFRRTGTQSLTFDRTLDGVCLITVDSQVDAL